MYNATQGAEQAGPQADGHEAGGAKASADNVTDAEFEEVK